MDPRYHYGVVYKLTCHDCDVSYIGQTKRQLGTRIRKHNLDINKKKNFLSVISSHHLEHN